MKFIYLLRHADTEKGGFSADDHARALTPRGQEEARLAGDRLGWLEAKPSLALCSDAARTRQTADIALARLAHAPMLQCTRALYLASAGDLLAALQTVAEAHRAVLLIGHNPGIRDLFHLLAGQSETAVSEAGLRFPTGCLAALELPAARWREISPGSAAACALYAPERIPGGEVV